MYGNLHIDSIALFYVTSLKYIISRPSFMICKCVGIMCVAKDGMSVHLSFSCVSLFSCQLLPYVLPTAGLCCRCGGGVAL